VTCTVTATLPTGVQQTISLTQQVYVYVPQWKAKAIPGTLAVYSSDGGSTWWLGATGVPGVSSFGMEWDASVAEPRGTQVFPNLGSLSLVQIITPYASIVLNGLEEVDDNNGETGLDTTCPYPWVQYPNSVNYYNYMTRDSPTIELGTGVAFAAFNDESFQDFLMYTPPPSGSGTTWVPLANFSWTVNGSATIPDSGNWASYTGSPGTITGGGSFTANSEYPMWTQIDGTGIDYFE
jgi:hypothetical protein